MKLEEMSKDEKSLLLFLETRAVDYGGRINIKHMNQDDMDITKKWDNFKFIRFGRIVLRHHNGDGTHWCKLSEEAWALAHQERRARQKRLWEKRSWISTDESMQINGDPHFSGMNSLE